MRPLHRIHARTGPAVLAAAALVLSVCLLSPPVMAQEEIRERDLSREEVGPYGRIDWLRMRIRAVGVGIAPPEVADPGQSRAMGRRAAEVDARRNLLEVVKGVHIDSKTLVADFMTQDDVVANRIKGLLQLSVIEESRLMSDGSYQAAASMPLTGPLGRELIKYDPAGPPHPRSELSPERPAPPPVPERPGPDRGPRFTGLVVDARGLGFRPTLKPVLKGPSGVIHPGPNVDRDIAASRGLARYYKDLAQAQQSPLAGDMPLTVKAASLVKDDPGGLVLDREAAGQIRSAQNRPGNFVDSCRVVVVF